MADEVILARPQDHVGLLGMGEAVQAAIEAFRYWAGDPVVGELRHRTHTPRNVRITLHQGGSPQHGTTGIMVHAEFVRVFGDVQRYPRRGRPVLVLYDADDGALKLILIGEMHPSEMPDANSVVSMPTACASMVGTELLARRDCRTAGVFGAGDQARHHLLALHRIRPSITSVRVFSPTPANRRRFADDMSRVLGVEVRAVDSPREVVAGADVVLCATNSNVPVFDGAWLEPGQHVTSVVSSNVGLLQRGHVSRMRREIDDTTLERADVLLTNALGQEEVDRTAVFHEAVRARPHLAPKLADIGQLMRGEHPGRTAEGQITYCKNSATWGVCAAALGGLYHRRLVETGRGLRLDVDPFEFFDASFSE